MVRGPQVLAKPVSILMVGLFVLLFPVHSKDYMEYDVVRAYLIIVFQLNIVDTHFKL